VLKKGVNKPHTNYTYLNKRIQTLGSS